MKKLTWLLIILLCLTFMAVPVAATDISDAVFSGVITISNNSTATTNVATVFTCNTTALIATGYVDSTLTNTAILSSAGADVAYMPGYGGTYPWALWVPSIGANAYLTDILYTGGGDMDSKIRYFPGSGGMTTPDDNADFELSSNFTIEQKGWLDAATAGDLTHKVGAIRTYADGSGDVSSAIVGAGADASQVSFTAGDDSNVRSYGAVWLAQTFTTPANWISVSDIRVMVARYDTPGTVTVSIRATSGGEPTGADLLSGTIDGDTFLVDPGQFETITPTVVNYLLIPSTIYAIVLRAPDGTGVADSAAWRYDNANGYAGGQLFSSTDSGATWTANAANDFLFNIYGKASVSVTASSVSSGEHTIVSRANGTFLEILVDAENMIWNADMEIGDPPTSWSLFGAGASQARSAVQKKLNSYSLALTRAGANTTSSQSVSGTGAGKTYTLGGWVYATQANAVRIYIDDGAQSYTSFHTGDSTWQWLSVTKLLTAAASVRLQIVTTDTTAYFDGIVLVEDSTVSQTTTASIPKTAALGGASVLGNGNNYTFLTNYAMPYLEYQKVWIGGQLRQHIEWEYGATFQDQSAFNNDATPSFRTTSSDPDVSASLTFFSPITESDAPAYSLSDPPDIITSTPNMTGNFTITMAPTYPGREVIREVAIAGEVPEDLPTMLIATFFLIVVSFAMSYFLRKHGHGSLLIKTAVVFAIICIYIALGIYDVWQAYMFFVMALGIMWMSRQREAY